LRLLTFSPHKPRWWVALVAIAATAWLVGCGDDDGSPSADSNTASVVTAGSTSMTTAATPVAEARRGHWRFARRPLVVALPHRGGSPGLGVYFKLNHKLTSGHRIVVSVNGVSNYDLSGTGYDSVVGTCYFKLLDNTEKFPRSLRRIKAGQPVRVAVRIARASPSTLSARVPAAVALPNEDEDVPSSIWLKKLACRR
jgi:hypothetical protein